MKGQQMEIKKLGFGLMRLPRLADNKIDIEQSKKMVDMFIESGFNYFDTAWVYEGSEDAARKILVERYPRDSYFLTSKLAFWDKNITCQDDCRKQFEESLKRTNAQYFDYYLIHCLEPQFYEAADKLDVWSLVKEFKEQGKIKHYGFSFHGKPDELDNLLNKHPDIEFVQLQINYADWNNPRVESRKNYEVAKKHNKPVIIMEPVKGGRLSDPNPKVKEVFDSYKEKRSYSSWAIRFAASLDGVMTVLSGMSNIEQMTDNTSYMKDYNGLSDEEKEIVDRARIAHESLPITGCTGCNYCAKVCPQEIPISKYFSNLDGAMQFGIDESKKERFNKQFEKSAKPDDCLECGACEGICPQHLPIREYLKKVKELF